MSNIPPGSSAGRTHITRKETLQAFDLLRAHVTYLEGREDVVRYEQGWSDARVAKEIGPHISPVQIARLRSETIGKIASGVTHPAGQGKLRGDIDAIKAAHNALCDAVGRPQHKV